MSQNKKLIIQWCSLADLLWLICPIMCTVHYKKDNINEKKELGSSLSNKVWQAPRPLPAVTCNLIKISRNKAWHFKKHHVQLSNNTFCLTMRNVGIIHQIRHWSKFLLVQTSFAPLVIGLTRTCNWFIHALFLFF